MRTNSAESRDALQSPSSNVRKSLWTLPELASEAQVCRRFLELEIARGRLRATRLSNLVRVRERDWQAYLDAGATTKSPT